MTRLRAIVPLWKARWSREAMQACVRVYICTCYIVVIPMPAIHNPKPAGAMAAKAQVAASGGYKNRLLFFFSPS